MYEINGVFCHDSSFAMSHVIISAESLGFKWKRHGRKLTVWGDEGFIDVMFKNADKCWWDELG